MNWLSVPAFTVTDTVSKANGGTFAAGSPATQFQTTNTTVDTAVFRTNGQTVDEDTTIASTKTHGYWSINH